MSESITDRHLHVAEQIDPSQLDGFRVLSFIYDRVAARRQAVVEVGVFQLISTELFGSAKVGTQAFNALARSFDVVVDHKVKRQLQPSGRYRRPHPIRGLNALQLPEYIGEAEAGLPNVLYFGEKNKQVTNQVNDEAQAELDKLQAMGVVLC